MSPPRAPARSPPGLSAHSPSNSMVGSPPQRPGLDELADCFAGTFAVSNAVNDTNRPHPRFAQYKQKTSGLSQELRRKKMLEHQVHCAAIGRKGTELICYLQKSKRDDLVNHARCLAMGEFDEDKDEEEEEEDMDTSGEVSNFKICMNDLVDTNPVVSCSDSTAAASKDLQKPVDVVRMASGGAGGP